MTQAISDLPFGLTLFGTAYDPLDLASDSIDPLGFLKAYLTLADRLLPGFTTITSVPRYLPMLCAGIRAAERLHPRDEGREPAKARGKRLEVLRNFEKVWAVACGLARDTKGDPAVDGLRGYQRYVRPFLLTNAGRQDLSIGNLNLLTNQVRYGGIGAYGQMLEECHFVDWSTLALRPFGWKLAEHFPEPPAWSPEYPNKRISKATLSAWGEKVCLDRMTADEAKIMRAGLNGGIEAERDDDVRWQSLLLLKAAGAADEASEADCLRQFCGLVAQEQLGDVRKATAIRQLRVVAPLIERLEQTYQSLLFLFDEIRVGATENATGFSLTSLDQNTKAAEALAAAQRYEGQLRRQMAAGEEVDAAVASAISQAMRESGITALAENIAAAGTVADAARVLIQRHATVQSDKFDRNQPKAPWLRLEGDLARLTTQRNELLRSDHAKSWRNIGRHPYRTWAAGQFIRQCRIT